MSKSVTNVEIEDVLSSIRRLVSEDTKPKSSVHAAAGDKLVLTAADRVPELASTPQSAEMAANEPGLNDDTSGLPRTAPAERVSDEPAEVSPAETASDEDLQSALSGNAAADAFDEIQLDDVQDEPETRATDYLILNKNDQPQEEEAAHVPSTNPDDQADQAADIKSRIAVLEEAVDGQPDEWEPDGSEMTAANDDVVTSIPAFMHRAARTTEVDGKSATNDDRSEEGADEARDGEDQPEQPILQTESQHDGDDQHGDDQSNDEDHAEEARQDRAPFRHDDKGEIEEAEAVQDVAEDDHAADVQEDRAEDGGTGQDAEIMDEPKEHPKANFIHIEDDEDVRRDYGDQTIAQPDKDDAEIDATVLGTAEAEEALEAALSDDTDEDAYFDEDAIRDMVRDIVREELQGVLGERITRNVRKLVRREIHRALTSNELE